MKKIFLLLIVSGFIQISSAQTKTTSMNLCDNSSSYMDKVVQFSAVYTQWYQKGNQCPLRGQGTTTEELSSIANYGYTTGNDKFYTRLLKDGCPIYLRIPHSISVPNATEGEFIFTGKVIKVGQSSLTIEVSSITRP